MSVAKADEDYVRSLDRWFESNWGSNKKRDTLNEYLFFLWTFLVVLIQRPSLKDTQGLLRKENSPVDCF